MATSHSFVPDDEGLFCLFCGRTAGEHLASSADGNSLANRGGSVPATGIIEEEDDWDAIQEELKRLTRRCQQESEAREKAELLLAEMKSAFEKQREDVGQIRTWGSNTDGQLGHYGGKPSLVEIRGILRQLSCGGAHTAALTDDGQLYVWGRGNEGQLGLGDYRPRAVPALVKALGDQKSGTSVLQVACGASHTVALCDNGDVYAWGLNEDMQLGLGATFGRKVNRPELVSELSGKGVLRVAAGKNFSLALTESGDVYSWGAGSALQLGHGSKVNEEAPRLIEMLREVRKLGGGAAAEHAAALVSDGDLGEGGDDELQDELYEAEDLLDKARARREDAMRAMRADVEALGLQVSKVDAKLSVGTGDDVSRLHALRDSIKGEIQELEIVITGKAQLEESLALLNKHKTNDFRTSMLMRWSRPRAATDMGNDGAVASGGYSPRTLSKKQAELRQLQQDKKMTESELRDCDDQLEQIELEKARLEEAVHDDQDITEALEELREQLSATKKERLAQLQLVEQAERALATELGVALDSSGPAASGRGDSVGVGLGGTSGAGGGPGLDANTVAFVRSVTGLWRKLEASSIEKLNIGQQETLGVRDLLQLSNEQIDGIASELKRLSATSVSRNDGGEFTTLLHDLLLDSASCRKRLNDYTEGLLVQTAQKLDGFKAAFQAARSGAAT